VPLHFFVAFTIDDPAGYGCKTTTGHIQSSFFIYEIGLFLELVFFLMRLTIKTRENNSHARETERLKAENLMKGNI